MKKANKFNSIEKLLFCVMFSLTVFTPKVAFSSTNIDGLFNDQTAVLELMRLETTQLLEKAYESRKHNSGGESFVSKATIQTHQMPILKAIYGVGNKLTVEVNIDGKRFKYKNGQKNPLEASQQADSFLLSSIANTCVTLEREMQFYKLCLDTK